MDLQDASERDADLVYDIKHLAYADYAVEAYGAWDEAFQRAYTKKNLPLTRLMVVNREVIGWIAAERGAPEVDIVDVHVLPGHQRRGYGLAAIRIVLGEAEAMGKAVTAGVLRNNSARSLYERLGFVPTGETKTHILMRRPNPPPDLTPASIMSRAR
jgi:ribosomal protein S18 acetylase RimI-like enzyme